MDEEILLKLIDGKEDEHCEFKEAKDSFSKESLLDYCCALYNEGGGTLILGVRDKKPRIIVGSLAFQNIDEIKYYVLQNLRIRIEIEEFNIDNKRVVSIVIPSLTPGSPISNKGRYRARSGESLVDMSTDQIKSLLHYVPDPSNVLMDSASIDDLDINAIRKLRELWSSNSISQEKLSDFDFLNNCRLILDSKVTQAALIITGKESSIRKFIPHSEAVFEYRIDINNIQSDRRFQSNKCMLFLLDDLWNIIDGLNTVKSLQVGLFRKEIKSFNEIVIREALLNAFVHRDYNDGNSVFIKMDPSKIIITSPGGLPKGVTVENILDKQSSRNQLIADIMQRINWIERSGQGFDKMWQNQTLESKSGPDLTGTDEFQVNVTIDGIVHDPMLFDYLEKINANDMNVHELVVINHISFNKKIPTQLHKYINTLFDKGYIEKIGTGKGIRYILSKSYYNLTKQQGKYTKLSGLSDTENKSLILKHISNFGKAQMHELLEVLSNQSRRHINVLLKQLKDEGKIRFVGSKKTGMWITCE